jgi:cardiolipin synthase A/B
MESHSPSRAPIHTFVSIESNEVLYHNGDSFFEALLLAIDSAKQSVDLETYIFDEDALGLRVLESLSRASERGVHVRLLLDGVGASNWNSSEADVWRKRGIHFRFFHPLPWQRRRFRIWNYLSFQKIALGFSKLNHRNHRKTCIVDGKLVFIGSMNVSERHLVSAKGALAWRDTSVCVRNQNFSSLTLAFEMAWNYTENYTGGFRHKVARAIPFLNFRLNFTPFQSQIYRRNFVDLLNSATVRVWITNPYFLPDQLVFKAMLEAARRGVDFRMLLPSRTDFLPGQFASRSFYGPLMSSGVKIYEYLPSMLHAKILLIDDEAIVGSSNLNHRSFFRDLEIDLLLTDSKNVDELGEYFQADLKHAVRIHLENWRLRSFWITSLERLFLLFRGIF